uniref:Protein yippee-like n=1 Tax=Sus scrofa TaxID=9823 RepID=A0A8D0NVU1_PIG
SLTDGGASHPGRALGPHQGSTDAHWSCQAAPTHIEVIGLTRSSSTFNPKCKTWHHFNPHNGLKPPFPLQSFQGSQGRAYLFNSVVNVGCGPAEERVLLTGLHAVADIYCENCKTTLGWKYEHAFESSQKYKEGKFIIELAHMIKDNGWE